MNCFCPHGLLRFEALQALRRVGTGPGPRLHPTGGASCGLPQTSSPAAVTRRVPGQFFKPRKEGNRVKRHLDIDLGGELSPHAAHALACRAEPQLFFYEPLRLTECLSSSK